MKKNQDDFQYLQNRFQAEHTEVPSSLSEQAMFDKLNRRETEKHPVKIPRSKRKTMKSLIAVAACFAIIVGTGSGAYAVRMSNKPKPLPDMTGVSYFTNYRQLTTTMKEIDKKNHSQRSLPFLSGFMFDEFAAKSNFAVEESYGDSAAATGQAKTGASAAEGVTSYAETNKQVDAVDEADIIKTDAHYIYYIANGRNVKIFTAGDGDAQQVYEINTGDDVIAEEMYLVNDTLMVVGTHQQYYNAPLIDDSEDVVVYEDDTPASVDDSLSGFAVETTASEETEPEAPTEEEATGVPVEPETTTEPIEQETTTEPVTEPTTEATTEAPAEPEPSPELERVDAERAIALTYDISDRTAPVLTDIYEQSGSYLSSRMTGGNLYLVSYYYNYDREIPLCGTGGNCERLPIENIVAVDESNNTNYAIVGAVNTADGSSMQTNAVLGVGSDIYCNENNLYLFGNIYQYRNHYYNFNTEVKTQIVKYALDGTDVELTASARVDGTTDNQFSLDEKDGNLRIATTSTNSDFEDTNNLYVLDEGLNEIGKVTGFANNEHIEAVRYVGDTAYVITFERTDPLFIIDLSKPKKPTITGEVKIDGFSTFLKPVDENTLLGIGYYTEENEFGGVYTDGLKLALFDVSDKNNPRVLDEASFPDAYSAAQDTHKALVHNSEKGYYAIPITVSGYTWDEYGMEVPLQHQYDNGILQFTLDGGRFRLKNLQAAIEPQRCTFIGDYLYAVDADGKTVVTFPTE